MAESKKINSDYIGGAIVLIFALIFQLQMQPWGKFAVMAPKYVIIALLIFGVILLIKGKLKPTMMDSLRNNFNASMLYTLVVGLLWVFLLEPIGFITTSFIALFALLYPFHPKKGLPRLIGSAGLAAGELLVLYLLFSKFLNVALPKGILF
ncbi:hypothetical protein MASR2M78_21590 [Treponema sp.]